MRHVFLQGISLLVVSVACLAEAPSFPLEIDITHSSIDELLSMSVSSVSKTDESFWDAPAAVFVLTNEKIRRSGATSIPEALRLVPGINVARVDANKWALSARGFNARSANKLQVLIDGRSVYDLVFSGVLWETKDVMLEDVERIEVIRGPGGTIWGANAVNGVINIITKSAKQTQGGMVNLAAGNEERGFGNVRYGTSIGDGNYLRVYSKYYDRDAASEPNDPDDDARLSKSGFRFDRENSARETLTFQGDFYQGSQGNVDDALQGDQHTSGGNLLLRWNRKLEEERELTILSYYDHTELDIITLGEIRNTWVFNLDYVFKPHPAHRIVSGLHYQHSRDDIRPSELTTLDPDHRNDDTVSAFVEDTIRLIKDKMFLVVGSKIEHNDHTGGEVQPTVRLSFMPDHNNTFWTSVSRAVRVPSRLEEDVKVFVAPGLIVQGNPRLDSEKLIAYEIGARSRLDEDLVLDLAGFYNSYDQLVSGELLSLGNGVHGNSYGGEVALTWEITPSWRIESAYSYFGADLELDRTSLTSPSLVKGAEKNDPHNQFSIHSLFNINDNWEFDTILRYVDRISRYDVDSYIVADLHIGYKLNDSSRIALVGQNLLDGRRYEQRGSTFSAVDRGFYVKYTWTY